MADTISNDRPRLYDEEGDLLLQADQRADRIVMLPAGDARASTDRDRIRIEWGQFLLADLLARFTETWAELAPEKSDRALVLQDCIERLAARARQMVRLRYYEELTAEQIAVQIGGKGASVRVALQRIRHQLRECVRQQLAVEGESR